MINKNRSAGPEAVAAFIRDMQLPFAAGQDAQAELYVSAKAGDKWRLTRASLAVDFRYKDGAPEVHIASIGPPFYRAYQPLAGTHFSYDTLKAKLFIEGHLNKGRGDPYVICLSR
ncbi:hypothetical protein [Pollutimonas bauzanensis]|uniref:Uncharacterized protein n=1 Tax=Pollutimonas bauzanensis TaxID=658167 RepID=A0A1M5Z300_9BURK|nr:hypothetical protein [Pollutimonas bauzanensis]SHI18625.1 hypothetical protein SAMN04488135_11216 [Pollutimonas bauzanensis]